MATCDTFSTCSAGSESSEEDVVNDIHDWHKVDWLRHDSDRSEQSELSEHYDGSGIVERVVDGIIVDDIVITIDDVEKIEIIEGGDIGNIPELELVEVSPNGQIGIVEHRCDNSSIIFGSSSSPCSSNGSRSINDMEHRCDNSSIIFGSSSSPCSSNGSRSIDLPIDPPPTMEEVEHEDKKKDLDELFGRARGEFSSLPDPGVTEAVPGRFITHIVCVLHMLVTFGYLGWRWADTLRIPYNAFDALYILFFLGAEHAAAFGFLLDHLKTWNQIRRPVVSIGSMIPSLPDGQAPRITLLITTAGEPLEIVATCLRGAMAQMYPTSRLSIMILDDKNRPEVCLLMHKLAELRETGTFEDFMAFRTDDGLLESWINENTHLTPANKYWCREILHTDHTPSLIYLARDNTPDVEGAGHMKAGNLNAGIWWYYQNREKFLPEMLFVDDCRHELTPHCLDRMAGYLYTKDESAFRINDDLAFVQMPQRFDVKILGEDLMGNHAPGAYDKNNVGQDGKGCVMSSGHGFLVRWDVLMGRWAGLENKYTIDVDEKGVEVTGEFRSAIKRCELGTAVAGFPTYSLIEDTELSMNMFMRGWSSVYVLVPCMDIINRLSICLYPPPSIYARKKQLYRWYLGANQLFIRVLKLVRCGTFKSQWHKLVVVDAVTYPLQSIPAVIIMTTPIIYCACWIAPFETNVWTYMSWFGPMLILHYTGVWLKTWVATGVPLARMWNDECVWLASAHLHIYALSGMIGLGSWVSTGTGQAATGPVTISDKMDFNSALALYPTRILYRLYQIGLVLSLCNWWANDWGEPITLIASFVATGTFMWKIKKIALIEDTKPKCDSKWHTMILFCVLSIVLLIVYTVEN
jgi:cellulose synthase/poly-beta-1,6-N-acetylglucosamine synthase-like glycosyltransferase